MSASSSPVSPSPRVPERPRRRFVVVVATVVAVVLVALFAIVFALLRQSGTQSPTSLTLDGAQAPASWVTYRDPAGYFTIRVPPEWHANVSTGQGTFGDPNGSYSFTDEEVNLGTTSNLFQGLGVSVYAEPISTAFARQFTCASNNSPLNSSVAGLPATDLGWTWLVNTESTHFQISTPFSPHSSPPMSALPTPVPQATTVATQHLLIQVISTFRPIPATPLKC